MDKAIKKYGIVFQMHIAIEEMSELTKELIKYLRDNDNVDKIAEEIADVEIMIDQLKILFGCWEKSEKIYDEKIKRLEKRINNNQ